MKPSAILVNTARGPIVDIDALHDAMKDGTVKGQWNHVDHGTGNHAHGNSATDNYEIKIRPMMYVALSYDHRLIDGQQAVLFLVRVKELMEDPASMLIA